MPANYVLLEKITVGAAGASSVTFSGIPQTGYTDLVLKGSTRTTRAAVIDYCYIYPNGSADMSGKRLGADGSSIGSSGGTTSAYTTFAIPGANSTANTFGNFEIYFTNYNSTTTYKSFSEDIVAENNATLAESGLNAILYKSNTAISSIEIYPSVGSFVQYSTFYLYGVAKLGTSPAISPYATGGDTIMTDGTYWYHTFVSSGTFTPQKTITSDFLVIAGGGGGGIGGGGAGGYRTSVGTSGGNSSAESALSLTSGTAYTVTVGAGGGGYTQGSNSVFSTITSTGGGRGQITSPGAGGNGGSGGGAAANYDSAAQSGGTASTNQGSNGGGVSATPTTTMGGGGGGASAVGGTGAGSTPGNGGNGLASSITGTSVTRGGGGGGKGAVSAFGTGGTGGGGNGESSPAAGVSGTANTGGGGGGGYAIGFGNGGSGLVIVRYAV